jgi:hypothetical protein
LLDPYSNPSSEKAREHLATATTLYREMEMRFWLEKAQTALGPLPANSP